MGDTAAITELKEKAQELATRSARLSDEHRSIGEALSEIGAEREAIRVAIRSLGGEEDTAGMGETIPSNTPSDSPRPTIRTLATRLALASGGVLKVRALLSETQKHGFKSDAGGLHTSLKAMPEFSHSGPGEFTIGSYTAVVRSPGSNSDSLRGDGAPKP